MILLDEPVLLLQNAPRQKTGNCVAATIVGMFVTIGFVCFYLQEAMAGTLSFAFGIFFGGMIYGLT